jgi:hypothetical protein
MTGRRPLKRPAARRQETWPRYMAKQLAAECAPAPVEAERPRQVVVRVCLQCRRRFEPQGLERICGACSPAATTDDPRS